MASTDRPGKITPPRRVAAWLLVVVGVFLLSASLGATSWVLTALGVALIGGGIVLYLVSRFNPGAFTLTRRTTVALVPIGAQPVDADETTGASEVPLGASVTEEPAGPLAVRPAPGTVPFIELDLTPARPARSTADPRGERLTGRTPRPTRITGTNPLPGDGAHDNQAPADPESAADFGDPVKVDGPVDADDAAALADLTALADLLALDDTSGRPEDSGAGATSGSATSGSATNGSATNASATNGSAANAVATSGSGTTSAGAAIADTAGEGAESGSATSHDAAGAASGAPGAGESGSGVDSSAGTGAAADVSSPQAPPRRRPSPRPRPPADDSPRTSLATGLTPYPLALESGESSRQPGNPAPRPRPGETDPPGAGLNGASPTAPDEPGAEVAGSVTPAASAAPDVADAEAAGRVAPAVPAVNGRPPVRPAPPRILRLIPARPAAAAIPGTSSTGSDQISQAYQKVSPPPGEQPAHTEGTAELTVHNLGDAVEFYRDQLGLVVVHIGSKQAMLQSGDAFVRLTVDRSRRVWPGALIHVMLEVEEVRAAYLALVARGVRFVHEPRRVSRYHDLELWSAAFRDPDGHGLAVIRWDLPPEQS